jgi:hypothetical protein
VQAKQNILFSAKSNGIKIIFLVMDDGGAGQIDHPWPI